MNIESRAQQSRSPRQMLQLWVAAVAGAISAAVGADIDAAALNVRSQLQH